jgi:hypothetical protein
MPARAEDIKTGDVVFVYDCGLDEGDFRCIDCRSSVHIVREHSRDGLTVRRHFRHNSENQNCASGGGGGESDIHERRKYACLAEALSRFDCDHWTTEMQIGEKIADAVVTLSEEHDDYGLGFCIEYQHRNTSKDLEATAQNYAKKGFTTLVLWDDQVDERSSITNVDLFGGMVATPFPKGLPNDAHEFDLTVLQKARLQWVHDWYAEWQHGAPATLPPEWCDEQSQQIWHAQPWDKICHGLNISFDDDPYPTFPGLGVTLPPEFVDEVAQISWKQNWDECFKPPKHQDFSSEYEPPSIDIPFNQFISREQWVEWYSNARSEKRESIEKPPNPFNDVQCWQCGTYWHYKQEHIECPHCGTRVDWPWNVATNRIDSDCIPKSKLETY